MENKPIYPKTSIIYNKDWRSLSCKTFIRKQHANQQWYEIPVYKDYGIVDEDSIIKLIQHFYTEVYLVLNLYIVQPDTKDPVGCFINPLSNNQQREDDRLKQLI